MRGQMQVTVKKFERKFSRRESVYFESSIILEFLHEKHRSRISRRIFSRKWKQKKNVNNLSIASREKVEGAKGGGW